MELLQVLVLIKIDVYIYLKIAMNKIMGQLEELYIYIYIWILEKKL